MTGLKGVLFDKDGTLIDFAASWRSLVDRLLNDLSGGDLALTSALGGAIGYDLRTTMFLSGSPVVSGSVEEIAEALAPLLPDRGVAELEDLINKAALKMGVDEISPVDGLAEALARLKGMGLRLGVGTHDAEGPARAQIEAMGVADQFDFVAGYDSGHGLKPGPGMPHAFAKAIGAEPGEIAMIGDSLHDLGAGRAAGCGLVIGVLTGPAREAELKPHADMVLHSVADFPDFLMRRQNPT